MRELLKIDLFHAKGLDVAEISHQTDNDVDTSDDENQIVLDEDFHIRHRIDRVNLDNILCDPRDCMDVYIYSGRKDYFFVQPSLQILHFKYMIYGRHGYPPHIQMLIYAGQCLKDETTLQQNNIGPGATIGLFFRK